MTDKDIDAQLENSRQQFDKDIRHFNIACRVFIALCVVWAAAEALSIVYRT